MGSYVLFQMNSWTRQRLIEGHLFYVEQGRRRVMDQFSDLEGLAEAAGKEWLQKHAHQYNPDGDDTAQWMEWAQEHAFRHGEMLSDLKDQMRLAIIAGMFHNWEKEIRDWLAAEMQHWHKGEHVYRATWKAKFAGIIELLDCLGWNLKDSDLAKALEKCRLIVNVYKHGAGDAADDLKARHPTMIAAGASWNDRLKPDAAPPPASRLYDVRLNVSDDDLEEFSCAIVAFWKAAPKGITGDAIKSVPAWLERAFGKDALEAEVEVPKGPRRRK